MSFFLRLLLDLSRIVFVSCSVITTGRNVTDSFFRVLTIIATNNLPCCNKLTSTNRTLDNNNTINGKGKGKVLPITGHEGPERERLYTYTLYLTSRLCRGGWSTSRPLYPCKDPVPIVQEAGWAPGPVWTDAENLAYTGIRSPDRPARSESLCRLSYRGRHSLR